MSLSLRYIFSFLFAFALSLLATLIIHYRPQKPLNEDSLVEIIDEIRQVESEIKDVWFQGEEWFARNKSFCPHIASNKDIDFYRCNPDVVECYLRYKELSQITIPIELGYISAKEVKRSISQNIDGFSVKLKSNQLNKEMILPNSCFKIAVPKRVYRLSTRKDYLWDNFYYSLFVDKYQTLRRYYSRWDKGSDELDETVIVSDIKKIKEFCEFRGGSLLSVKNYEAASTIPSTPEHPKSKTVFMHVLPWGRAEYNNPFRKDRFTSKECLQVYTKDCLDYKYNTFSSDDISWMGMNQILGGLNEVLSDINHYLITKSSMEFDFKSKKHRLFQYYSWTGEPEKLQTIIFEENKKENTNIKLKLGFRCQWIE